MHLHIRCRVLAAAMALSVATAVAAESGAVARAQDAPSAIVVGFVGGFVRHDNPNHGPVQFAERLRKEEPGAYVEVFENRHRHSAYRAIVKRLDCNHDGILSDVEKAQARIILYGHSWGASAAVLLARDLKRAGIPVLLTVQVDSVRRLWHDDRVIPANVAAAANFYQPHGLVHGRAQIEAADVSKTQILGNYRFDYHRAPVSCEGYSWADRLFTRDHMQSECDPDLWGRVDGLVRARIAPGAVAVAK